MQNLNLWLKTFREQQRVSMIKNNQIREPDQRFFPSKDKKKKKHQIKVVPHSLQKILVNPRVMTC